jgi:hypothetical protein
MQNGPYREDDRKHEDWLIREQRLTIRAMILTLAIVVAPFLALLWGVNPALSVLGVAMLFTATLCFMASREVGPIMAEKLRNAGWLNGILGLIVLGLAAFRVWGVD